MVAKLEAAEREREQKHARRERDAVVVRERQAKDHLDQAAARVRQHASSYAATGRPHGLHAGGPPQHPAVESLPGAVSKKRSRAMASGGFSCPDCGKKFTKGSGSGKTALANHSKAKGHGVRSKKARTM